MILISGLFVLAFFVIWALYVRGNYWYDIVQLKKKYPHTIKARELLREAPGLTAYQINVLLDDINGKDIR